MIQRIQSVWLFLASLLSFLTLKLSFYSGTYLPDNQYHQLNGTDNLLLMITTIALGILTFITIFLYKKSVVQLRLTVFALLLDVALIYLYYQQTITNFTKGEYAITAALHLIIILALLFAAKGINNDEKLIKNSDRLR